MLFGNTLIRLVSLTCRGGEAMRRLTIMKFSSVKMKLDLASFLKEIKPVHFDSQLVRESEKKMSNSLARCVSIQVRSALCHSGMWKAVFLNLFTLRPFTRVKLIM